MTARCTECMGRETATVCWLLERGWNGLATPSTATARQLVERGIGPPFHQPVRLTPVRDVDGVAGHIPGHTSRMPLRNCPV